MAYRKHLPPPPSYSDAPTWRGNSHDVGSRIVRTAWEMLFTHDAANISLREVAHAVGVSAPAAYNHFRDLHRRTLLRFFERGENDFKEPTEPGHYQCGRRALTGFPVLVDGGFGHRSESVP